MNKQVQKQSHDRSAGAKSERSNGQGVLEISDRISLPADAVTQTLACIGRKGAGKTYLATKLAEEMLTLPAQIVVIDPVGTWWGLRVAADGKTAGKEIFIAGGDHADVPILPDSGARFARLVVEKSVSIVMDVSGFRQGERKRFAADFAEEFFHLKKSQRSAVHLFVEEAQLFAPQRTGPEEARMLGAFENIIRLGRNYGIGATLISQRPQSVNKEVLSQVECLCVLQVNGTHERKALEEWVQEAGADRKLVGELPGLSRGEGFVWSPSWLRIFERVRFGAKVTFDASATPEVGRKAVAARLTSVDVEALKIDLQEVISKAEKDDPRALRSKIRELELKLQQMPAVTVPLKPDPAAIQKIVLSEMEETGKGIAIELQNLIESTEQGLDRLRNMAERLTNPREWTKVRTELQPERLISDIRLIAPQKPTETPRSGLTRDLSIKRPYTTHPGTGGPIAKPQQRILNRLAELLAATGAGAVPKAQLAAWSEYSPTGGGFNNYLGQLRSAGMIEYPANGTVTLSQAGRALAEPDEVPDTNAAMLERAERVLGGSEAKLLRLVASEWPRDISKDELANDAGFSANGGGFNNYLGHMRTLGFIDYPLRGRVKASDWLFVQ